MGQLRPRGPDLASAPATATGRAFDARAGFELVLLRLRSGPYSPEQAVRTMLAAERAVISVVAIFNRVVGCGALTVRKIDSPER